jgi:hypothetical protein
MSLLDQLKSLEADVAKRLRELEPAHLEYTELERVAQRLGIERQKTQSASRSGGSSSRSASTRRRSPRTSTSAASPAPKRAGQSRGRPSKRAEDIVKLVAANPGITVAQLGKRLKVDPTGLYAPVRRLQQEGRVQKDGPNLQPGNR